MDTDLKTRPSLLDRLRSDCGDRAWQRFYDQYRRVILSFCTKRGLDLSSAEDVLQETVVLLMRKLPDFEYDPNRGKFRNWLLKLVAGKVSDARKRAARARLVSADELFGGAGDALRIESEAREAVEISWRQALVEEAFLRIKADSRTKPGTFMVFQKYVLEGLPVSEVARLCGVEENTVYQIKNRLLRRVSAIVMALEDHRSMTD